MKALAWFHRWIGIGLCLMFATWFATGAVMVFVAFPALPEADRLAHSAAIDWSRVRLSPLEARQRLGPAGPLVLAEGLHGPQFVARDAKGLAVAVDAQTGAAQAPVRAADARAIAQAFAGRSVASVSDPFDYDQWVVHQQFDPWRPFYRVRLADPEKTELYVSVRTGQVLQRTREQERAWNWVGSVIHWIYVVPIRKSFAVWDWTVWVLSLVGLTTVVAGLWLGVSRTSKKMRSKRPDVSPFRGLLRWHHILGLGAGAFVLAWITSGWLSMDHGRLFSEGLAAEAAARTYAASADGAPPRTPGPASLSRLAGATEVAFEPVAGRLIAAGRGPDGSKVLVPDGQGGGEVHPRLPEDLLLGAVRRAWPQARVSGVEPVVADSAYAKAEGLSSDAVLVRLGGGHPVRLYLDGLSGRILVAMDPSREAYAWVYYMVHTYNYPGLAEHPALRIAILLVPLSAGFAFSVTGVIVGVRRLRAFVPAKSHKS